MNLFAGVLDLSSLALAFVPDVVFVAFLFGVAAYIWNVVQEWCQQGKGPWRERLVLPTLFTVYWFVITYPIHSYLTRRWPGALLYLPWVCLAAGLAVYLSDLRRPRFWALFYGATELVFTLAERFGGRLLAGRPMFLVSNRLVWTLLVMVVTAAATGVVAFAVHFVVGLFLKLWERNSFFWAGSAGVLICVLTTWELWYHAPALATTGFAQYVVPTVCLLTVLGFASGYAATSEYCYTPLLQTVWGPPAEARELSTSTVHSHGGAAQQERRQQERQARAVLGDLGSHGFFMLSGVRVLGNREVGIDCLLMGPNGFWLIEGCTAPVATYSRRSLRRSGGSGSGRVTPEEKVQDLKIFLSRYIGDMASQISYHCLAWDCGENRPAWLQGAGTLGKRSTDELRVQILKAPGTNPLPEEMQARIMLLLLRETVDRTRRDLEQRQVPDVLPRLAPTKYEELGLSLLASDEEIDRRFEELSGQYASGKGSPNGEDTFAAVRSAYEELKADRQGYDERLWEEAESTLRALRAIQDRAA